VKRSSTVWKGERGGFLKTKREGGGSGGARATGRRGETLDQEEGEGAHCKQFPWLARRQKINNDIVVQGEVADRRHEEKETWKEKEQT